MIKRLKSKRGEGYIDVAITVMIVTFVLVFSVNIVSLVALNQNMKTIADQLVDYAAQSGTTSISAYAEDLSIKSGIKFTYSFDGSAYYDGTEKVQLGDKIQCTVTHNITMLGFGNATHPMNVEASASGISRYYWK